MPGERGGPYLLMAVFCEKVLQEADGVISVIRIVDRINIAPSGRGAPAQMPTIPLQLPALLSFKSGFVRSKCQVHLRAESPSGKETNVASLPVFFEGDDRGVNLILNLVFQAEEEGLYWFSVSIEDDVVTRIPLRILYQYAQGELPN
jgi:hypothetical protein